MNSCFPPLAALSLRNASNSSENVRKSSRSSTSGLRHGSVNTSRYSADSDKIEILQDLDLYYIRQIARSLKVNFYFFKFSARFVS